MRNLLPRRRPAHGAKFGGRGERFRCVCLSASTSPMFPPMGGSHLVERSVLVSLPDGGRQDADGLCRAPKHRSNPSSCRLPLRRPARGFYKLPRDGNRKRKHCAAVTSGSAVLGGSRSALWQERPLPAEHIHVRTSFYRRTKVSPMRCDRVGQFAETSRGSSHPRSGWRPKAALSIYMIMKQILKDQCPVRVKAEPSGKIGWEGRRTKADYWGGVFCLSILTRPLSGIRGLRQKKVQRTPALAAITA